MSRFRGERTPPMMPPRKRDWKPGTYQLGLFLRTPNGSTLESVSGPDGATAAEIAHVMKLYRGEIK